MLLRLALIILGLQSIACYGKEHVLVLHSYDMTYAWTQKVQEGLGDVLKVLPKEFEVHVEFLDSRRYRSENDFKQALQWLKTKYKNLSFTYVLTTDDDAYNFYLNHYNVLFANSVLFFAGKGSFDDSILATHPGKIRGVLEYMPLVDNLRLGERLHQTNQVYFITDASTTGIAQEKIWRDVFSRELSNMNIRYVSLRDFTHQELQHEIAQWDSGFIQVNVVGEDKNGLVIDNLISTKNITQVARIPVYAESSMRLGHGVLGGVMLDGRSHGNALGQKFVSYVNGNDISPAIVPNSQALKAFDYQVMKRFLIDEDALPKDSLIINRPQDNYERYKELVWGMAFALFVAFSVIGLQAYRNDVRKRFNLRLTELVKLRTHELEEQVAEQKRLRTVMVLKEKLASLGLLTAGIAHELKNPLNIILNSALLIEKKSSQPEIKSINQFVIKNTRRADSIIQSMLGQIRNDPTPQERVLVSPLIEEAAALVYHSCLTRYPLAPAVRKDFQSKSEIVLSKENMLRVFINLLENSYYSINQKAKESTDGYQPDIQLSTSESRDAVFIEFSDNGVGIPNEIAEKIWLPFYSTKPVGEGSGLGLSMVHDIILAHNGDISLDTQVNEYCRIKISLPKSFS